MEHTEIRELLEAYVLGALDSEELAAVEAHLSTGCAECTAVLRDLNEVAVRLAESVPEHGPPPRVKEQLLARISQKESRSGRHALIVGRTGWFIAAAAAAALVVLMVRTMTLNKELVLLKEKITEIEDVTELLEAPGMEFVDLKGVEPNAQAFGKVVIDSDRGKGIVYMYKLPQTPAGKEYQLWVMREGIPSSAGVFTVAEDGSAMLTLTGLEDVDRIASFAVTIEPAGGLSSPAGMMYLTGPKEL